MFGLGRSAQGTVLGQEGRRASWSLRGKNITTQDQKIINMGCPWYVTSVMIIECVVCG